MDDAVIMKLDAIKITDKRATRTHNLSAIKLLEQKLRNFFNEADGHGSLMRKPPPTMFTEQYFKTVRKLSRCSVKGMDWMSLITTTKFKKKFSSTERSIKSNTSDRFDNHYAYSDQRSNSCFPAIHRGYENTSTVIDINKTNQR